MIFQFDPGTGWVVRGNVYNISTFSFLKFHWAQWIESERENAQHKAISVNLQNAKNQKHLFVVCSVRETRDNTQTKTEQIFPISLILFISFVDLYFVRNFPFTFAHFPPRNFPFEFWCAFYAPRGSHYFYVFFFGWICIFISSSLVFLVVWW